MTLVIFAYFAILDNHLDLSARLGILLTNITKHSTHGQSDCLSIAASQRYWKESVLDV